MNKKEKKIKVLIVGAGRIGREYLKILNQKRIFEVKGIFATSNKNLKEVKKITKKNIFTTNENFLKNKSFDLAIIAVPVDKTFQISKKIMKYAKTLLIEKPPSLNLKDANNLLKQSELNRNKLFVALNRAYFDSTIEALKIIKNNKNKRIVEVTDQEDVYSAKKAGHSKKVLNKWMYANSIHMVDYFRLFCRGRVKNIIHFDNLKSTFDKKIFISKIIFSSGDIGIYKAFWNLPNKWQVKIISKNIFINLFPLEKISIFENNIEKDFNLKLNKNKFKEGYLNQINDVENFFQSKKNKLVSLKENLKTLSLIKKLYF